MMRNLHEDPVKYAARLEELARLKLNESGVDDILNEYVKKAAEAVKLPVSLVSIVLDSAQTFAAAHGLGGWIEKANGTPVEWSFCVNSVRSGQPFVVEDAKQNEIVKDNPLVTQDNIRCYAGVPLITKNGHVIGNFCVIGTEPREFTDEEMAMLHDFAEKTVERLEQRVAEAH